MTAGNAKNASYEPSLLVAKKNTTPPFPHLFSPIKVGDFMLRNRIVMAPMGKGDCDPDGTPNDQTICGYVSVAKGGVGMIVTSGADVTTKYGRFAVNMARIEDLSQLLMWKQLSDAIHAHNVVAVAQIFLGMGRMARRRLSKEIVAPSAIPAPPIPMGSAPRGMKHVEGFKGPMPRELTTAEVEQLEDLFVAGARKAKGAGFDGIEIHATDCLIGQFLMADANRRTDKYGGSLEKRLTFPLNLIAKTRKTLGNRDFLIGIRIPGDQHYEGGCSLEETKMMVPRLVEAGLDYVHVYSGSLASMAWILPPKDGMLLEESAEIKKACSVPVICPNVHHPRTGEEAIKEGKTDIVSLGRGLVADPEWPNKAREGRVKDITRCIFCNTCQVYSESNLGLRCSQNPRVGWERFLPEYWPTPVRLPPVTD